MFQITSRADLRRPQPWILLWMLPYLVFSVLASPFHLHSADGREMSLSALAKAISGARSSSHDSHQRDSHQRDSHHVEKSGATTNAGECFSCEWSANASSFAVAMSFPLPVERAQIVAPTLWQTPRFLAMRTSRSRGPPVSLFSS